MGLFLKLQCLKKKVQYLFLLYYEFFENEYRKTKKNYIYMELLTNYLHGIANVT